MSAYELTKTILKDSANLKAYYRMEAGALTTDSSASGYTLTNNGTVADGTGVYGGAADQGTSNSTKYFTRATAVIAPISDYTISLWVKLNTEISSGSYEFLHLENNTEKHVIYITYDYNAGTRRISVQQARWVIAGYSATYNVTLGTSNWHHIVMRKSGTFIHLYFDGAYVSTSLSVSNVVGDTAVNNQLLIGAGTTEGTGTIVRHSSALIDDVAIFQQALSADQIKELYEGRYIGEWMPQLTVNGYAGSELNVTSLKDLSTLKAYYRFESDVTDSSSNGNNGSATAVTYASGQYGNAGVFDGSTSFVSVTDSASTSFTTAVSASAWIKLDVATGVRTIIGKPRSAGGYGFSFDINAGKVSLVLNNGTTGYQLDGTTTLSTGTWYHVICTWNGTTGRVYLNGNQENSSTSSFSSISDSAEAVNIGRQNAGLAQYFDGMIDDLAVFNTALSADQIDELYKRRGGLQALYHLSSETDYSGNNYHLTNSNTVTFTAAKYNNGANFSASNTNKALSIASNLGITTGAITMSCWIKGLASIGSGTWEILHHSHSTGGGNDDLDNRIAYDYNAGTRRLQFQRYTNTADGVNYTVDLGTTTFFHLVYVFDGSTVKGYVNGNLVGSVASTSTTYNNNTGSNFRIGRYETAYNYASILIDEVAIFSRALTAAEIRHWYAWSVGKYL